MGGGEGRGDEREVERVRDEDGERDDRPADEGRAEATGNGRGGKVAVAELAAVEWRKLEWRSEETRGTEEGRQDGSINMPVGDVQIKGRRSSAGC